MTANACIAHWHRVADRNREETAERGRVPGNAEGGQRLNVADAEFAAAGSFERFIGRLPAAFAVTRGDLHTLIYANVAFCNVFAADAEPLLGSAFTAAFAARDTTRLTALLDRAFRTGLVARDNRIEPVVASALPMSCTVWPEVSRNGETKHLVIELRAATQGEITLALQREVAERLLLSALRERDAADLAETSRRGAAFLAAEGRRLVESLDESATLVAMERMSLTDVGDWCIVDTLDDNDTMHRLAIIHPDPAKQLVLEELEGRWIPKLDDKYGLPAALRNGRPMIATDDVDASLANAQHDPEIVRALRQLGAGPLLTVPLVIRDRLIGAITFVGGRRDRIFSTEDVALAEALASLSARALDRARAYGEAIALKVQAEAASEAKSLFLGMVSHELLTPLNAIGGYVDILDLEIHGPITAAQRVDLSRIRRNQRHVVGLINDLLNLTRVNSGQLEYNVRNIVAQDLLTASLALVEPLIAQKQLICELLDCDSNIVVRGDPERVSQILVNLLSNCVKFTPPGGRLVIDCEAIEEAVLIRVSDTGIGIPSDKLDVVFEPFIQLRTAAVGADAGLGLGLAISRRLARDMHGELTVESTLGEGSRFTLTLPRSSAV